MGIFDIFDGELIAKVKAIVNSVDQDKITQIFKAIEVKDGKIVLDLKLILTVPEKHEPLAEATGTTTS